jgi:glycerate kinase
MKKVLIIPDSFKGTMSSAEICDIMADFVKKYYPRAQVIKIPVADGGEGSVDAFLSAIPGVKKHVSVKGPYFEDVSAFYGLIDGGKTAVIEMAACAGIPLVGENRNPLKTTTYGVGQLLLKAVESGAENLIVGLGGSATNDGGAGAAAAAGVRFFDKTGKAFIPVGGTLIDIYRIDASGLDPRLKRARITAMCDIDNPLCGLSGAAHVFGPQKGADYKAVKALDAGLSHLADVVKAYSGTDFSGIPGAGAAGGMGFGMRAFFGSELRMGIETVLDAVGFDSLVAGADFVFSGEGKLDTQSLRGKVVAGVARRAKAAGVPLIAVVGDIGDGIGPIYDLGVTGVFSINRVAVDFKNAKRRAKSDLALTMDNLLGFIKSLGK